MGLTVSEFKHLPQKIPLWKHQLEGVARGVVEPNLALFYEVGTGKTATMVNILRHRFYSAKRVMRTLIVGTPAIIENWRREILAHSNIKPEAIVCLKGSGEKRRKAIREAGAQILITNYETLAMEPCLAALLQWCPEIVVADESQKIKKITAKRTKGLIRVGDFADHRYILTGTPITNSPMEIFSQYRFLDCGQSFGTSFFKFRNHYFYDKNAGMPTLKHFPDWQPRPGAYADFNSKIYRKALRVKKEDCLDLPPLVRKRIYVDMAPDQAKNYKQMKKAFIAFLGEKACTAELALTKALRLQQIVSGFFMDTEEKTAHSYAKNPRLDVLMEQLQTLTPQHKVIVWAVFRENYKAIEERLIKSEISYRRIVGGIRDSERQGAIDDFQNDDSVRVMLANQAAGGVGITLTQASYSIYYSRGFSLEQDIQSEARNYRAGSEVFDKVTRIDLVCQDTIDETVLEALARKEKVSEAILKMGADYAAN